MKRHLLSPAWKPRLCKPWLTFIGCLTHSCPSQPTTPLAYLSLEPNILIPHHVPLSSHARRPVPHYTHPSLPLTPHHSLLCPPPPVPPCRRVALALAAQVGIPPERVVAGATPAGKLELLKVCSCLPSAPVCASDFGSVGGGAGATPAGKLKH